MQQESTKWYKKNWLIILSLIFLWPLGLFLMWKNTKWKTWAKITISIVVILINIFNLDMFSDDITNNNEKHVKQDKNQNVNTQSTKNNNNEKNDPSSNKNNMTETKYNSSDTTDNINQTSATRDQRAALNSAESYSKHMHLSKKGIYRQLTSEYGEKFSPEDAQYAIDHLKADYNTNALENAKNMDMSTNQIYDQLISEYGEQFTPSEAKYAIDHLDK
ncbi:Ltp family lipoprotein [Staphylococcus schweitzeri]|uniref:Surface lipoprotein-related protein n=1 Tax=Staphylococcus schweitzeri TaxID=1654388 RepID=A0A077UDY3_9STAP|nr:Ltp family lipoprotein [Staphylococcus schweitzeri]CDR26485.1 surface lipoprotein-related protein [Staphylococcus schweitzeri]